MGVIVSSLLLFAAEHNFCLVAALFNVHSYSLQYSARWESEQTTIFVRKEKKKYWEKKILKRRVFNGIFVCIKQRSNIYTIVKTSKKCWIKKWLQFDLVSRYFSDALYRYHVTVQFFFHRKWTTIQWWMFCQAYFQCVWPMQLICKQTNVKRLRITFFLFKETQFAIRAWKKSKSWKCLWIIKTFRVVQVRWRKVTIPNSKVF